ncbi:MAG: ATP-binding protein [Candidatus Verstraetearchaeota archaeon]|nr:ATP-binding protein [Candidatus Verstraetearchaeota archaeon]
MRKLLFDPSPKRKREDLYDFDEELAKLQSYLGQPLVAVVGLRRTGKTSLILTALEESGHPYIFFDLRTISPSTKDLYQLVSKGLEDFLASGSTWTGVRNAFVRLLKLVRGVSISGVSVDLAWGRGERPMLTDIFGALNEAAGEEGSKLVIAVDEVQRATGQVSVALQNAFAYSYDHLRNLSFVISGSEMQLLYRLLEDPEAPLYGRAFLEVKTRRLARDEAEDFLEKGFEEAGVSVGQGEIEEAAARLDGIIGWLTYYGYSRAIRGSGLDEAWRSAVNLAGSELANFLACRVSRERYRLILKLLARGVKEWGGLKSGLEDREGKRVSDRVLYEILETLRKHSLIDEHNDFQDPLLREAAKGL